MAVAKRQGREKPAETEQRKVRGPEWGPQVEQTALLAGPIYIGQAQGEEKRYKKRSQRSWALCLCLSSLWFFFFFFLSFFLNLSLFILIGGNYFTILYWFCHISTWIRHGCTCVPILNPPPTSFPEPSLWVISVHQHQASCILHWTWTGNSFPIWYTGFNAILPNHPTLSLSHRVQKTVLYICVSFAVSHTGLSLPSF